MTDKMKDLLAGMVQAAPQPGVPMSRDQLAMVAAEVDRLLAELPPGRREEYLREVLQRMSAGALPPVRDLLLAAGQGLKVEELAKIVTKPKPTED